jgi:hypothetical protein
MLRIPPGIPFPDEHSALRSISHQGVGFNQRAVPVLDSGTFTKNATSLNPISGTNRQILRNGD